MPINHDKEKTHDALGISQERFDELEDVIEEIQDESKYDTISKKLERLLSEGFRYEEVVLGAYLIGYNDIKKENANKKKYDISTILGKNGPIMFGPFSVKDGPESIISILGDYLSKNQSLFSDNDNSDDNDIDDFDNDLNDKYTK